MAEYQHLKHEFAPVFNNDSKILILGTFPSVKSREQQFYYGHPQNRFWKVLHISQKSRFPQLSRRKSSSYFHIILQFGTSSQAATLSALPTAASAMSFPPTSPACLQRLRLQRSSATATRPVNYFKNIPPQRLPPLPRHPPSKNYRVPAPPMLPGGWIDCAPTGKKK